MFEQIEPQVGERFYHSAHTRITKGQERQDGRKTFTFVISTESEDRHGTVIDPAGIDVEAFAANPVVLLNHDHNFVIGRGIGKPEVKGGRLIAQMEFDEGDPTADMIKGKVERGFMNATSIGFMVKEWTFDEENDVFKIVKSELVEFSIVSVPSNRDALVLSRDASAIGELKQEITSLRQELRKLGGNSVPGAITGMDWIDTRTTTDNTNGEIAEETPAQEQDATAALETEDQSADDSTSAPAVDESQPIEMEVEDPAGQVSEDDTAEVAIHDEKSTEPTTRVMNKADFEAILERKLEEVLPKIRSRVRRSLGKE